MQRGITAEIYGDPAIDAGDIIRCSEGDIDQRRSVVGLVTKQEWRYRDYHTIICASAQLSEGIEEAAVDESSTSQTQAVGDTDEIYPVKVVAQSEKKSAPKQKEYYAGDGLSLYDDVFILNAANSANLGGIRLSANVTVPDDDETTDRNYGIYKASDAFPAIRTARKNQKGGMFLGDGLVPHFDILSQGDNSVHYKVTDYVELRLGDGLEFVDESYSNVLENARAKYGGRAVSVPRATNEKFGIVKLGKRIGLDEEGKIYAVMSGKKGIEVSEDGEISVLVDNDTIRIDGNGKLATRGGGSGVSIDNAVIIKEADATHLLHNYTEVKYVDGNRIGYAGAGNQIIVDGYIVYKNSSTIEEPLYTGVVFSSASTSATTAPLKDVDYRIDVAATFPTHTNVVLVSDAMSYKSSVAVSYDVSASGLLLKWINIMPPTALFPFGYCTLSVNLVYINNSGALTKGASRTVVVGFASEAEYNAAIGLTYEPLALTEIKETVTEV